MSSQSNSPSINVTSPSASSTISSSSLDAKIGSNNFKVDNSNSFTLSNNSSSNNKEHINSNLIAKGQNSCSSNELQQSLHLNSNWNTSDSLSEKSSTVKRDSTCDKCKNHHQVKQIKDHKINCPYKDCNCGRCLFTVIRRRVTSANQRKRRQKLSANEKDIFDHERIYERLRVLDLLTWDLDIMIKEPSKGYCKIDDDDILNLWSILKKYLIQGVTLIKAKKVELTDSSNLINNNNNNNNNNHLHHHISNGHNNNSNSENLNCNLTTSTATSSPPPTGNILPSTPPIASSSSTSSNCLINNKLTDSSICEGKLQSELKQNSNNHNISHQSNNHLHSHLQHHFDQVTNLTNCGDTYNGFKLTPKMQCKSNLKVHLTSMKFPEGRLVEPSINESSTNFSTKQSIFGGSGLSSDSGESIDQNADGKLKQQSTLESPMITISKSIQSQQSSFKSNANSPCSSFSSSNFNCGKGDTRGNNNCNNLRNSPEIENDFKSQQFDEQINCSNSTSTPTADGHKQIESQFIVDPKNSSSTGDSLNNLSSVNIVNTQINSDLSNFNHSLNSPFESISFGHFKLTPSTLNCLDIAKVAQENVARSAQTGGPDYSPTGGSDLFSTFSSPIFNSFNRSTSNIRPVITPKPFLPPLAQEIYNHHHQHHHHHHPGHHHSVVSSNHHPGHPSDGTYFSSGSTVNYHHRSNIFGHNINHRIHPYAYHPYTGYHHPYHGHPNSLTQMTHNNLISDARQFTSPSTPPSNSSLVNNPFLPDSLKPNYLREPSNVSSPMQPLSTDDLRYNRSLIAPNVEKGQLIDSHFNSIANATTTATTTTTTAATITSTTATTSTASASILSSNPNNNNNNNDNNNNFNNNNLLANCSTNKSNEQTDPFNAISQSTSSSSSSSSSSSTSTSTSVCVLKSENKLNKYTATHSKYDEANVINNSNSNKLSNNNNINSTTATATTATATNHLTLGTICQGNKSNSSPSAVFLDV